MDEWIEERTHSKWEQGDQPLTDFDLEDCWEAAVENYKLSLEFKRKS